MTVSIKLRRQMREAEMRLDAIEARLNAAGGDSLSSEGLAEFVQGTIDKFLAQKEAERPKRGRPAKKKLEDAPQAGAQ